FLSKGISLPCQIIIRRNVGRKHKEYLIIENLYLFYSFTTAMVSPPFVLQNFCSYLLFLLG
ncbi:TPA: hypothetical protein ACUKNQ_003696, partial [Escherichia coli]